MKVVVNQVEVHALARNTGVRKHLHDIGVRVRNTAQTFAPVRTGHYLRSLFVRQVSGSDPHVVVGATDWKAWWIEFGAYDRPDPFVARAPLRRALAVHRLKFVAVKK